MLIIQVKDPAVPFPVVAKIKRIVSDAAFVRLSYEGQLDYVKRELPKGGMLWTYRGGSHVAVHYETGKDDKGARIALIVAPEADEYSPERE